MVKRKKRLTKGIKSIEKQIEIHKHKREEAKKANNEYLVEYYNKEIGTLIKTKEYMEYIIEKQ